MDAFRQLWEQAVGLWNGMTGIVRIAVVAVIAIAVLSVGYMGYRSFQTDYVALARNVPLDEVGVLTAKLKERNITYRLDDGGTTVSVPTDKLATARVEAVGANISTASGKGMEVFDESPLGMTPFVQGVNYTRALQTELARSIAQLKPVAQARVHINRPESTPFIRDTKPTTASVALKLKPNVRLDRSSADAIVALVSRAVEGLPPENVSVIDMLNGQVLTESMNSEDRIPNAQLEFRRQYEAYLASKAEEILRLHLGSNRAVVRVAADINFQRVKERSETYAPDGKVIRTEQQQTSKSTTPASGGRGVAGATANVNRANATTSAGQGSTSTENTQTTYELSKTSRELDNYLNSTNRLNIAAMIDLSDLDGKKLNLTDAQDLIKRAVGFQEGRDEIKVADVALVRVKANPVSEDDETALAQQAQFQWVLSIVRNGLIVLGLLLLAILVMLIFRRVRQSGPARLGNPAVEAPSTPQPAPEPPEPPEIEEFRKLAETNPDRVVEILAVLLQT